VNSLANKQFELNQTTAGEWRSFTGHRHRISDLLLPAAKGGRICVLGAGNCNDLHLAGLTGAFEEVVLVDLDPEALSRGTQSQPLPVGNRLRSCGNIDVTGALERIATWSPATKLEPEDLDALAVGAETSHWPTGSTFDVVASTCLLSQLVGSLTHSLTDRHPQFLDAVQAIRTGHVSTMASLLRPGGRAVLISDVVSSDTLPELLAAGDPRNFDQGLVATAIKAGNFFTGLNPAVVHGVIKSTPLFKDVNFVLPWIWRCGPRAYAVYAIEATRA